MTRDGDATPDRGRMRGKLVLRPSKPERGILFLVYALIPVCAFLTVFTNSSGAVPMTNWQEHSLERFAESGWKGASFGFVTPAQSEEVGRINLTVVVTDAETGQPINQARLTLEFTEPGDPSKLKRSKKLSYSAKTNVQGHYKFPSLPKGTIRLIVTAERHQTFSKEFELEKENEAIEVKLKKPQPLL